MPAQIRAIADHGQSPLKIPWGNHDLALLDSNVLARAGEKLPFGRDNSVAQDKSTAQ